MFLLCRNNLSISIVCIVTIVVSDDRQGWVTRGAWPTPAPWIRHWSVDDLFASWAMQLVLQGTGAKC